MTWVAWEGYVGTAGVRVSQLGSYGANADTFTNANSIDFLFGAGVPKQDLMVFEFGTNDYNNNIAPATYKTNLQTLITAQLASGGDAALLIPPPCGATGKTYTIQQYATACYELADTNGLPVIDLLDRWGDYATANAAPVSLMSDQLHPNQAGHDDMANAVMDVLRARPSTVSAPATTFNTGRGGLGNTAVGVSALIAAKSDQNTAVGYQALLASTTATQNTAIGYKALSSILTAGANTAVGLQALQTATGVSNTAIGSNAAQTLTSGTENVAVGQQALFGGLTAAKNVMVGVFAGYTETPANATVAAQRNTFIGYQAGPSNATDPADTVAIGYRAHVVASAIAIGSGVTATGAGSVAIGKDNAGTSATATVANEFVLGTALHTVRVKGTLRVDTATATTVGAGGAAAAIPTPVGYLPVSINGVTFKIPYVNV
jgi:lysophospholipase L1-like esterase